MIRPRLFLFLKACYHTGARPSGVLTIQVKHINFSKGTIHIRAMKQGKTLWSKSGKRAVGFIKNWIKEHDLKHDNFIFYPVQLYKRAKTDKEKQEIKKYRC